MNNSITLTQPDDWHIHLRDGDALKTTVTDAAKVFHRVITMPNTVPPITTAEMALAYADRIKLEIPPDRNFTPLMVLYLTDRTSPEIIKEARSAGVVACKLYPAGATTNSDSGVTDIAHIYPAIEAMQECGMRLLIHGEVTDSNVDIFDREKIFIDRTLQPLVARYPQLPIVLEHITTRDATDFVTSAGSQVAATITPHHLLFNRNHMLVGGIRPHFYCLPILKRNIHQTALLEAAISGNPKFFLGTDSAPHARHRKEAACGCAGVYNAPHALELYAEAFDEAGAIERLEDFASHFGADFYDLPRNETQVTLEKTPWQVPESIPFPGGDLMPVLAGETLQWKLVN